MGPPCATASPIWAPSIRGQLAKHPGEGYRKVALFLYVLSGHAPTSMPTPNRGQGPLGDKIADLAPTGTRARLSAMADNPKAYTRLRPITHAYIADLVKVGA